MWAEYLGVFLTIFVPGSLFVQSGEGYGVLRLMFLSTDKKKYRGIQREELVGWRCGGNGRKEGLYRKVRINSLVT